MEEVIQGEKIERREGEREGEREGRGREGGRRESVPDFILCPCLEDKVPVHSGDKIETDSLVIDDSLIKREERGF